MATISLPTPLRPYADRQSEVSLDGNTVGELLEGLVETFPKLKGHLFGDDGKLRSFVNVYVNDEDIRHLQKSETPVKESDQIAIIPAIAGGNISDGELSTAEIARYSRHLILPEVGMAGQKRLKSSSVLLVGTGGLGSPAAMYLAAAGVGRLGIVDFDVVDSSNLQRQVIHGESTVGQKKVDSAEARLKDINPHIEIIKFDTLINSENALEIIKDFEVVADGTDNFPTRYLINDACVMLGKPNVYASIFRFEGQLTVFNYEDGPCYRCLYPEPPPPGLVPSCAEGGVIGVLPGIMGSLQANEVIKILTGIGEPMNGRLLTFDALSMKFRELKLRHDHECVVCGDEPTVTELIDYVQFCGMPQNDHQQEEEAGMEVDITPIELKERLGHQPTRLVDVREPHEWEIGRIEGATLIPLGEIEQRTAELPKDEEIVLYCKMGGRSMKALNALKEHGFVHLKNLKGGINAWSRDVDPSVPQY